MFKAARCRASAKRFICGLEAIYDIKSFRTLFGDTEEDRKELQRYELLYPQQVHPVVRVHPVSGRKVLFVNPQFTVAIKGMNESESRSMLDTLFRQAMVPEYQFRHRWSRHTIAMWDNRPTRQAFEAGRHRFRRTSTALEATSGTLGPATNCRRLIGAYQV